MVRKAFLKLSASAMLAAAVVAVNAALAFGPPPPPPAAPPARRSSSSRWPRCASSSPWRGGASSSPWHRCSSSPYRGVLPFLAPAARRAHGYSYSHSSYGHSGRYGYADGGAMASMSTTIAILRQLLQLPWTQARCCLRLRAE